jgi:hypothetical protein
MNVESDKNERETKRRKEKMNTKVNVYIEEVGKKGTIRFKRYSRVGKYITKNTARVKVGGQVFICRYETNSYRDPSGVTGYIDASEAPEASLLVCRIQEEKHFEVKMTSFYSAVIQGRELKLFFVKLQNLPGFSYRVEIVDEQGRLLKKDWVSSDYNPTQELAEYYFAKHTKECLAK